MKKIIIYVKSGSWVKSLYCPLGMALEKLGYEPVILDVNRADYAKTIVKTVQRDDIFFSIGHNDFGINAIFSDGDGLYEKVPIPHVAVLDDAPYNSVLASMRKTRCMNLIVGVRDRSHLPCLRMEASYPMHRSLFLPHWSVVPAIRENLDHDRDIDILNSATYYGKGERFWRNGGNIPIIRLLDDVADCLVGGSVTVYEAFSTVLKDRMMEEYMDACYKYFTIMYQYIKTYRREKCLEPLIDAGMRVTVCSPTWKNSRLADGLNFIGEHSYENTLELYKRTKVLIQENAEFNSGIHDRMLNAMMCGATVVSEYSDYIAEEFQDGKDLFFYQWDTLSEIPTLINRLLTNRKERHYMAQNAFEIVSNNHLPEHRAQKILEAVTLSF